MDFLFIIVMMLAIRHAMRKHDASFTLGTGLGDFVGWAIAIIFMLAFVRLPIYLAMYGFVFPFKPSVECVVASGAIAVAFWWTMIYYRVPKRLLGRK